jgi:hypothetical protein
MGIYADLAKKRADQYDKELEGRVRDWMNAVLGITIPDPFRESLSNGQIVCDLLNKLKPGIIPKVHRSKVMLFCRENFGFFQKACLKIGLQEAETAVFEDVYDDRNMGQFLTNIIGIARFVQFEPGYDGPILQDAAKNSGHGAAAGPTVGYIPSFTEQAGQHAADVKAAARYTQHGIMMNPNDPTAPKVPQTNGYIPTAEEEAAAVATASKAQSRYVEHGIVMNPDENPSPGKK